MHVKSLYWIEYVLFIRDHVIRNLHIDSWNIKKLILLMEETLRHF